MKNILYLFLAVTIFACSSDDTNDNNSNQTFLEKYDGVVWDEDFYSTNPEYSYRIIVSNNPKSVTFSEILENADDNSCYTEVIGNEFFTIIENSGDRLVYVEEATQYTTRLTVNDNVNLVSEGEEINGLYTQYFSKTQFSNPCQ
tara:strand:+ start:49 stop:480 length:432 start_codon:yes stop_codon:yes gene_type:complete